MLLFKDKQVLNKQSAMKRLVFIFAIFLSVSSFSADNVKKLEVGEKAVLTEVKMKDVSGELVSLSDALKKNGLLVLFSCNQCPFVLRWESRYNGIKEWADKNKVGMIVLNSNYQKRNSDDSYEAMQAKAKEKAYRFNYVVDKESVLANAFGGQTTPHAFLFDGDLKLAYKGAIDDSYQSAEGVKEAYLKNAIANLGAGEQVAVTETKPVGCGIKRKVD